MNKSLYELTADMQQLENGLNQETNEETYKYIDSFQIEINDKLEGITCIIKNNKALYKALTNEINTLTARKKALDKQTESLKQYVSECMQSINMSKFESSKGKLSFRKSSKVEITNEALITKLFKIETVTTKVDKKAIKEAIQSGEIIDGAKLVEHNNLQIK